MAPHKGSRALGLPRAGGYHVKTGCITCKLRHIKCDEEKPECQKCKSTGRKCDGYISGTTTSPQCSLDAQETDRAVLIQRPTDSFSLPIAVGGWTGSMDELRGFHYFRLQTFQDLAYSLSASLGELVLQNSHRHEAIKHAVIALGALGETIRINSTSTSQNAHHPGFVKHEFARLQYHKAIGLLQKTIQRNERESVETALITCFLFVVFEFLQGHDQSSTTHLRSGLAIIRTKYFPHADNMDIMQNPILNPMQSEITRIFHILDTVANKWLGLRGFYDEPHIPIDVGSGSTYISPDYYDTLDVASEDLMMVIAHVHDFRRFASIYNTAPFTAQVPATIYAQKDLLFHELDIHRRRLNQFLARQIDAQIPEDPHRISILRINRKITTIELATYLNPQEERFYAESMPQFFQVVSLATFILRQTPEMPRRVMQIVHRNNRFAGGPEERNQFEFLVGLIQPLYFTAIKCRDKIIAQKAIHLLEGNPWREGAWDSAAMARIAKRKMKELEESDWYDVGRRGTSVEGTGKEREKNGELSVEWPLATDPFVPLMVATLENKSYSISRKLNIEVDKAGRLPIYSLVL
ncbi:MAG: hypothetical protein Q9198_003372 [Flavoplaca austrocitrina]